MATEQEILKEQEFVSDRISTQVRTIALSMIAVAWLFLSGEGKFSALSTQAPPKTWLFTCIAVSFIALIFDYAQYVAGYLSIRSTHDKGPDSVGQYTYNYQAGPYKTRAAMFFLKQGALVLAVLVFVGAFLKPLF